MILETIVLLLQLLLHTAAETPGQIYTGFSYGAFWSETEPKRYKDFLRQFTLAKNLPNVPVPFTSARLYQSGQWLAPTEPSEAFQAAIETNTTLLLGLWLPIENDLQALDKAFDKFGQKLADLVIGIAVGNEDIYRGSEECIKAEGKPCPMTATADTVMGEITRVKEFLQSKPWYKLFKNLPPIGHADTARNAALQNADFVGANIFPFWHHDPVNKAWESFESSLQSVKERAGNKRVWITETGWPSAGTDPMANLENMQKYWSIVGCSLLGKYTTFWFELEKDTHDIGNLDWGIIDVDSQKPKLKDLSCPGQPGPPALPSASTDSSSKTTDPSPVAPSEKTFLPTVSAPVPEKPSTTVLDNESTPAPVDGSTTHVTITSTVTVQPTPGNEAPSTQEDIVHIHVTVTSYVTVDETVHLTSMSQTSSSRPVVFVTEPTGCITISIDPASGQRVTISNPPVNGKCLAPTYAPPSSASAVLQDATASPKPTVFVTEATGCITVSKDANGKEVTVASNPPVDRKCPPATYVPPSSKKKVTVIVSPSSVTTAGSPHSSSIISTPSSLVPPTSPLSKPTSVSGSALPASSAPPKRACRRKRHAEPLRSKFCANGHC
ncbi:glycoside hydrolase [Bimuria novae-zelandiae CBS 107.79]|uniref:Probable glucan endo-1,3-beta-glucosidase eglC n=1 Tax=Bimuria novae-zelandiae CBS 107.79 TaxID=1447943 RepID=A0A6A5V5U9_9PLEO|nr:glycoside hydrolase [Bimuria novae-zelandiae CBS 107.79]